MTHLPESVLVTGAGGFIGRHLVVALRSAGVDVVGDTDANDDLVDVTNPQQVNAMMGRHKPGAVVHLGGISGPMLAADRPRSVVDVNIGGTANLLEAARLTGTRQFVFASSNAVYGNNPGALDEQTTMLNPSSVYGVTKVSGEQLTTVYGRDYHMSTIALRICSVYGPGRSTHCIVRSFIEDALAGSVSRVAFGADLPRQYVHIDDVVGAIGAALCTDPKPAGMAINISGGEVLTVGDIAGIVTELLPTARIEFGHGPDPDDKDVQGPFVLTQAREVLGFEPQVRMRDGIARYIEHLMTQSGGSA